MQKNIYLIGGLIALSFILSACGTTAVAQSEEPNLRTLAVNGSGSVFLSPDIAYVTIGVQTQDEDVAKAVADNNSQSEKVANALQEFDIPPEDIQTTNFSIFPQQQFDREGNPQETTYIVNNSVFVTIRDLDNLGDILASAVAAGANSINSIQFDVEEKSEAEAEAREAAVTDAEIQAEQLADAAGILLGEIQSISTFGTTPAPIIDGKGGGGVAFAEAATVPISPGQMRLTVNVSIIYEIR